MDQLLALEKISKKKENYTSIVTLLEITKNILTSKDRGWDST